VGEAHPEVTVVIVNWRCAADTIACVESLTEGAPGARVVVVDNDSGDGSSERLETFAAGRTGVTVVRAPRNGGFGAGCNLGIERALADARSLAHVLLVNPDATAQPGMLDALLACAARHPDAGAVGGLILDGAGERVWYESGAWRPWTLGPSHEKAPPGRDEYETGFVTGALMLLPADLLRAGLRFDERFFLYCEDVDLSREIAARGRTLWVTRKAVLHHKSGATQPGEFAVGELKSSQLRWLARNKILLARKRLPFVQRLSCYVFAWIIRPIARVLRYGRVAWIPLYYRALIEGHRVDLAPPVSSLQSPA
jgi:GT2 family glycosyltransferase